MIPSSLIPDLFVLSDFHFYAIFAVVFVLALIFLLFKLAFVMDAAARWIEHDLKMRRGGKS
jgi:hypothetical protein